MHEERSQFSHDQISGVRANVVGVFELLRKGAIKKPCRLLRLDLLRVQVLTVDGRNGRIVVRKHDAQVLAYFILRHILILSIRYLHGYCRICGRHEEVFFQRRVVELVGALEHWVHQVPVERVGRVGEEAEDEEERDATAGGCVEGPPPLVAQLDMHCEQV